MLRLEKLDVLDEVANGLSFFEQTFLPKCPCCTARWRTSCGVATGRPAVRTAFVPADRVVDRRRPGRQPVRDRGRAGARAAHAVVARVRALPRAAAHARRRTVDDDPGHGRLRELTELADRSPDKSPHRRDEPYRRALTGLYARIAATARTLDRHEPLRHAIGAGPPYTQVAEFAADLEVIRRSLEAHDSALLARGRLRRLRRAVDVFGFHLAAVDLRQNSDVHQRVVTELFAAARPDVDYASLDEAGRVRVLAAELATPRLLSSPYVDYSPKPAANWRSCRRLRACTSVTGRRAFPTT